MIYGSALWRSKEIRMQLVADPERTGMCVTKGRMCPCLPLATLLEEVKLSFP